MIESLKAVLAGALMAVLFSTAAMAQPASGPAKDRSGRAVVGLLAGGIDSTDMRAAADLAAVIDDDSVRVMPIVGRGSAQALDDLASLRGVEVAILQSDVLARAQSVQYVAKLYNEELHVLARADIARIEDLAGKPVGFGPRGGGASVTGGIVFDALKIGAERVPLDDEAALEKLRRGELAALLYVAGRPAPLLRELGPEDGLHLLSLPLTPELLQTYIPSRLAHDDYPGLLRDGEGVDTVAVGAVMVVPAMPAGDERYRSLAQFVEMFFARFPALLETAHHPKWREVNLSAQLPGWTRFAPAEDWLRRNAVVEDGSVPQVRPAFEAFLDEQAKSRNGKAPSRPEKDMLFEQFLRWQQAR